MSWAGVVHTFNLSTREEEAGGSLSLRPFCSLRVYRMSWKTARATQKILSLKTKKKERKKGKRKKRRKGEKKVTT